MLPSKPPRSTPRAALLNRIGPFTRPLGKVPSLTIDEIEEIGFGSSQFDDTGHHYHRESLERLVKAAAAADLTFVGKRYARDMIAYSLTQRTLLVEAIKRHGETLARQEILPSFLVMGFPRTGTTHLHRLIAQDPRFAGIPKWRVRRPVPFGLVAEHMVDDRRERAVLDEEVGRLYSHDRSHIHDGDADTPEECCVMLLLTFHVALYWSRLPVYDWARWLRQQGEHGTGFMYDEYRWLLKILQQESPGAGFALKAPDHTPHLATIHEQMPELMVIHTHRDPVKCSNSLHSMIYNNHCDVARRVDPEQIARMNLDHLDASFRYNLRGREQYPDAAFDVAFDDIVKRPIPLIREIYEHFGIDWPTGHEAVLQRYLDANPKDKHGEHRYSSADFGLTDAEVEAHFSDYLDAFPQARPSRRT